MLEHIKQNSQLYFIFSIWFVMGFFMGPAIYLFLPLTLLLMAKKELYEELILGFFFILLLSDNLEPRMAFAGNIKNIYIIILSCVLFFKKDEFYPLNDLYKIFIPFFILSLYCLLYSPIIGTALQKTVSYALVMIVIPNFFLKGYRETGILFIRKIIYLGVILLSIGFLLIIIDRGLAFTISGRFKGVFGNPNGLGLFCFSFMVLWVIVNNMFVELFTKKERIYIYVVILSSLILCQSRNALIGCLILIIFEKFFKNSFYLGFVFLLSIVFLNYVLKDLIPFLIIQLHLENFMRLETLTQLSGRTVAWQFVWEYIQNNLFIGCGFGYDEFLMKKNYEKLSIMGHQGGVHNSYLSMWLNFGLIGLLVYFRSLILFFIKASKINNLAFPVMYAVLFSSTFEGLLIGSLNPHIFVILSVFALISEPEFQPSTI